MKKLLLFGAALALGGLVAPTPAQAHADPSVAATPVQNAARFQQLHQAFLARAQAGPIGVLFLGDSIVNHWKTAPAIWEKYYGKDQAVNFGIPGDMTQNVIWRIEHGELDAVHPRVVVFMLGTNNTGGDSAAAIFAADRKIIAMIRAKLPETKVLLLGIFPRGLRPQEAGTAKSIQRMALVTAVNAQLATLDDGKTVRYLDLSPNFRNADGTISPAIMADGVHPTVAGYQIWADAMQPLLDEMLAQSP